MGIKMGRNASFSFILKNWKKYFSSMIRPTCRSVALNPICTTRKARSAELININWPHAAHVWSTGIYFIVVWKKFRNENEIIWRTCFCKVICNRESSRRPQKTRRGIACGPQAQVRQRAWEWRGKMHPCPFIKEQRVQRCLFLTVS